MIFNRDDNTFGLLPWIEPEYDPPIVGGVGAIGGAIGGVASCGPMPPGPAGPINFEWQCIKGQWTPVYNAGQLATVTVHTGGGGVTPTAQFQQATTSPTPPQAGQRPSLIPGISNSTLMLAAGGVLVLVLLAKR